MIPISHFKIVLVLSAVVCCVGFGTKLLSLIAHADTGISTPMFFNQTDDSAQSTGSWYDDNWYQLGRGFAGTITSITLEGFIDASDYRDSILWFKEFSDPNYNNLTNTYLISDNAPFTDALAKVTFSGLNIPLNQNHYYRLDTVEDRQNASVILRGTPGLGTAMANRFVFGTGEVQDLYPFYPYIAVNGNFHEPLVIVPGAMGSRLDAAPPTSNSQSGDDNGTGSKEIWPDATDMANSGSDDYLDALKLAPDGTQIPGKEMLASDIIRVVTGTYNRLIIPIPFSQTIYGNLIKTFTDAGYVEGQDLFVAPYDWRLDIASSAMAVGTVIQDAATHSANGKVNVIAHSMGGLAVKEYLASVSSTAFVDKLIFSGVPQLGAPYVFKALQYGDDLGFGMGPFSILNGDEVKSIMQNMPGIYELLPSRRFIGVDGSYVLRNSTDDTGNITTRALSFDDTNAFLTADPNDSRNAGLLAAADNFHASQDTTSAAASNVFNLVGCQNPTPEQYVLHEDGSIDINRSNGDGSVPVDSAMNLANNYENYFVLHSENGVDHAGLVRDQQPLALIQAIVQGTTSSLALEPLGISTSSEDCLQGRGAPRAVAMEISSYGSSTIDVYDSSGNHTGPNDAGDVDMQIPDSEYDKIGDNTFVMVPASSTYKITSKSIKTIVKAKTFGAGAQLIASTTYTGMPLDPASSTAIFVPLACSKKPI
jgi:hypothetical protein